MPYAPVDINQIKLDPPDYLTQLSAPQGKGFVPVDINKIKMDAPVQQNLLEKIGSSGLGNAVGNIIEGTGNIMRNIPNQNPASSGLQLIGQGAKMAGMLPAQVISALAPTSAAQTVSNNIDSTNAGQYIGDKLLAAKNFLGGIASAHPELTADVGAAANIAGTIQGGNQLTNGLKNTVFPLVQKIESASQKLPGILGDTTEGVSPNVALGGIPNALGLRVKGALADSTEARADVSQANWNNASNLFKSSTANGAVLDQASAQNLFNQVKQAVGKLNSRTSDTSAVLDDFEEAIKGGNVTPDVLHEFRQNFNDVISSNTKSKIDGGGISLDGKKAMDAKNAISKSMAKLTQGDLSAGSPQAISDMMEGINRTAQAYRYDRVSQMLEDAQGDPAAIQRGAIRLLKNTNGMNKDEVAALTSLSKRGVGQNIERGMGTFGLDLGRTKNVALPAIAAGGGVPGVALIPHGLPLAATGTVLRQTGKYAARGKGQNLLDAIMARDISAPPVPAPPPSPQLLLPAPSPGRMIVNAEGDVAPVSLGMHDAEFAAQQQISNTVQQRLLAKYGQSELGQFVARNANKPITQQIFEIPQTEYSQAQVNQLLRNGVWNEISEAQKAKINSQIKTAWDNHQTSLAEMVMDAEAKAKDLATAKGGNYSRTNFGDSLAHAISRMESQ